MLRRAAPRVVVVLLLNGATAFSAAMTTGVVASVVRSAGFVVVVAALGSRQWWHHVKHGSASWRVDHGGATAVYVTDSGRDHYQVVAAMRRHDGLAFGAANERAKDPSRPVWNDLTSTSADRICAVLVEAGATVSVKPRPIPAWARDVTAR